MPEIKIAELISADAKDYEYIAKLLPQLSSHTDFTKEVLRRAVEDPYTHLCVARNNEKIVGVALLIEMNVLVERRGRIEDVVVDESYRGQGIGKQLFAFLINRARERELTAIELSSRPNRTAANALYQKYGFEQRETNVYRLEF